MVPTPDETPRPHAVKTLPAWRTGWTWAFIKCAAVLVVSVAGATAALYYALHSLLGRLPEWLPERVTRWVFEWALRHLWFVGPVAGLSFGAVLCAGIVVYDAKRGRLPKVR